MRLNALLKRQLEGAMDLNDKDFTEMPKRPDKTLSWLKVSRDSWKEKTRETKTKLKIEHWV